ncbi:MAG: carbon-nitrogen hydrolase family protein [Pseudomonadota bacterium]
MARIAAAAYPLCNLVDWAAYEAKLTLWIDDAAAQGAELLLFPEYSGAELATLGNGPWGEDHFAAIDAITARLERANAFLAGLAQSRKVFLLSGSAAIRDGDQIINRAFFMTPGGDIAPVDKLMPTRWEREALGMVGGAAPTLFETPLGKIGTAICYDCEFPLITRAMVEAGAEILLVPSCTETLAGYSRVKIGAMARALESQCWAIHAPLIGDNDWAEMVAENTGAAAIYGPPDTGFPPTGITAGAKIDEPGWTIADCDPAAVHLVRREGSVMNWADWDQQDGRLSAITQRKFA